MFCLIMFNLITVDKFYYYTHIVRIPGPKIRILDSILLKSRVCGAVKMATKRAHVYEDEQASSSGIVVTSNPKEDFKIEVSFSG